MVVARMLALLCGCRPLFLPMALIKEATQMLAIVLIAAIRIPCAVAVIVKTSVSFV